MGVANRSLLIAFASEMLDGGVRDAWPRPTLVGNNFPYGPVSSRRQKEPRRTATGRADAPARSRRVRGAGAPRRAGSNPRAHDDGKASAVADIVGAAGDGQDDAGAHPGGTCASAL